MGVFMILPSGGPPGRPYAFPTKEWGLTLPGLMIIRRFSHTYERSNGNFCHSEHSEESLFFELPRFFTPLRSVQNDITFLSFLVSTSYQSTKYSFAGPPFSRPSRMASMASSPSTPWYQ